MSEIEWGLEVGLDISKFDYKQMKQIRVGLKYGEDISKYLDPSSFENE